MFEKPLTSSHMLHKKCTLLDTKINGHEDKRSVQNFGNESGVSNKIAQTKQQNTCKQSLS